MSIDVSPCSLSSKRLASSNTIQLLMAEENKLNIRLHIYDTDMNVRIDRSDEELYRRAATTVTEAIGNYTSYYKGQKSDKEIHYMALVDIALRYEREARRNDVTPYSDVLKKLTSEIEAVISTK